MIDYLPEQQKAKKKAGKKSAKPKKGVDCLRGNDEKGKEMPSENENDKGDIARGYARY